MKIFLDDCRSTPDGLVRTYTSQETIELLKSSQVEALNLVHDLGDD
ncbi:MULTISPECIES: cyclic-phosphate processing receiver domain-containing protein [Photobacterium]|nr:MULTISPECIES: cyclic-phosphate processing receiver domain-containing protein [Photobacterium]